MAKILVTPVESSGVRPYHVEGELTSRAFPNEGGDSIIYFINGTSYPAEIVTILLEE